MSFEGAEGSEVFYVCREKISCPPSSRPNKDLEIRLIMRNCCCKALRVFACIVVSDVIVAALAITFATAYVLAA